MDNSIKGPSTRGPTAGSEREQVDASGGSRLAPSSSSSANNPPNDTDSGFPRPRPRSGGGPKTGAQTPFDTASRWSWLPFLRTRLFFVATGAAFAEELFGVSLAPVSDEERSRAHFFLRGLAVVAIIALYFLYARPEQQREEIAAPATAQRVNIAEMINQCVADGRCVGLSRGVPPTTPAIDLTRLPSGSIACLNALCGVARGDKGPDTHLSATADGALRVWARADRGAAIGFVYRPSVDGGGVHWRKEALPSSKLDTAGNPLSDWPKAVPR